MRSVVNADFLSFLEQKKNCSSHGFWLLLFVVVDDDDDDGCYTIYDIHAYTIVVPVVISFVRSMTPITWTI